MILLLSHWFMYIMVIKFIFLLGITNHDEYSLVRENLEEEVENKANFGTLTLKRKKEDKEREKDVKMEQLRKKLKTDDEGNISLKIICMLEIIVFPNIYIIYII